MQPLENREPSERTDARSLGSHVLHLRVRYSETDQMGTFYNSRPLEWFECGRTELLRHFGLTYAVLEQRGVFLPLVESYLRYVGRARYDDLLAMTTTLSLVGRARLRFDVVASHTEPPSPVVHGHTVHAFANAAGKPIRPPEWFLAPWRSGSAPARAAGLSSSQLSQTNLNPHPQ